MNWYKKAQEAQKAQNGEESQSQTSNGGAPLHNLTLGGTYAYNIYDEDADQHYGIGRSFDRKSIGIMQSAKDKPGYIVPIYRAIPVQDRNSETSLKLNELLELLIYQQRFGSFPVSNSIIGELMAKYPISDPHDQEKKIAADIRNQMSVLDDQIKEVLSDTINDGDLVSISRPYAVTMGENNLPSGYRITTKKVYAEDILNDGKNIHEWKYYP